MKKNKIVAFIPARSSSKRIADKNIRLLGKHPLLAYTICSAIQSGIFDKVLCATDSEQYAKIARYYGAEVPALRPENISGDKSSDVEWVNWLISILAKNGEHYDAFSILRPTSPFRLPETIQRAWNKFSNIKFADSLRAVQKTKQHPGKMWIVNGDRMNPIMPFMNGISPWHSSQYAALPEIYIQDASLEIAWTNTLLEQNSISGNVIVPFISRNMEGFDINEPEDWILAEHYIKIDPSLLTYIKIKPFNII